MYYEPGITPTVCRLTPSKLVKPARVARSPIQFECVYLNTLRFTGVPPMGTADE